MADGQDQRSILLTRLRTGIARFIAEIDGLSLEPDTLARVVMDSRSATVVIGQDVQISAVAVT